MQFDHHTGPVLPSEARTAVVRTVGKALSPIANFYTAQLGSSWSALLKRDVLSSQAAPRMLAQRETTLSSSSSDAYESFYSKQRVPNNSQALTNTLSPTIFETDKRSVWSKTVSILAPIVGVLATTLIGFFVADKVTARWNPPIETKKNDENGTV